MTHSLLICIIAFTVRCINLYFSQVDSGSYIVEDQFLYWDWALKNAYTSNSALDEKVLLERMPGAFLFFQFSIWLVGENLFNVLFIQTLIDTLNCLIIALIARNINKNLFFLTGLIAAFSPLLIIVSSQILSDTIFLFFFSSAILCILFFMKNKKEYFIYLGAIFLSLALFTRVVVLPLIFLILIFITFICYREKFSILKIIRIIPIFFIVSLSLAFPRMLNNLNNYNTISLTTQAGSHFAYWVTPAVLDFAGTDTKDDYKQNLKEINKKLETVENPFEQNNLLKKEALSFLLNTEKKLIFLAWSKGAVINIFSPSFIIDKRFRSLSHPSFYRSDRNLIVWLNKIFKQDEFKNYKNAICLSAISSLLFVFLFFLGGFLIVRNHFQASIFIFIISFYFIAVTGPVFSPKYIHPILPFLIIIESIALKRAIEFSLKFIKYKQSN